MSPFKQASLCPSQFCAAYDPAQALVSKRQAELVEEGAIEAAIRCSGCGCVWVKDQMGRPHVLGTLRKEGRAYKWLSAYRPPGQTASGTA
jgi:hypothetical protein